MTDAPNTSGDTASATAIQARRREIATEHVLFKLIEYVERRDPGLLAYVEASLDHLGDPARDGTKDDEAVRTIARKMLVGARREVEAGEG